MQSQTTPSVGESLPSNVRAALLVAADMEISRVAREIAGMGIGEPDNDELCAQMSRLLHMRDQVRGADRVTADTLTALIDPAIEWYRDDFGDLRSEPLETIRAQTELLGQLEQLQTACSTTVAS